MLRKSAVVLLSLVVSFGLFQCKGPTGPQGPAGTMNIITETFSIPDSTKIQTDRWYGIYNYPMRAITNAVVDSGIVLAYLGSDTQDAWTVLPYDLDFDVESDFTVDYTLSINYTYSAGNFDLTFTASADTLFTGSLPLGPYKVVVVPPGSAGQLSKVDITKFNAVRTALHLD